LLRSEKVEPLALKRRVTVAFEGKNIIGCSHLPKERTMCQMAEIQRWWDADSGKGELKKGDARKVVARTQ